MSKDSSVTRRVISGSVWTLGLRLFTKGMGAIQLFILGRILAPQDFGLFAVASLVLLAFGVLTRTGFDAALIQKRGNIEAYLDTAFAIQVMRGMVLAGAVFFTAPYFSTFFNDAAIAPVVRALALMQVLRGFRSLGVVLLEREMNFRTVSLYLAIGSIITIAATLISAWYLRNVWALVYGALLGEASLLFLSYTVHPYRPKLAFSMARAKEFYQFGVWLFLAGITSYVALQADNIAVGRWLSVEALGIYYMAYRVANLFVAEIARPLGQVLKPAYAAVQNERDRLGIGLEKSLAVFLAVFLPLSVFLVMTAHVTVPVVLGHKWVAIVPILPILVLGALFRGLATIGTPFFIGTGKPKLVFHMELVRALSLIFSLYPCFMLAGVLGIAWASMISTAALLLLTAVKLMPSLRIRSFVTGDVLPVSLSAAFLGILLFLGLVVFPSTWYGLILMTLPATIGYVGLLWNLIGHKSRLGGIKIVARAELKRFYERRLG